ncbi:hypothetical protein WR25_01621 [Diploscapter pachys]|uniref:Uncharacterized protein n=1 Tax=Diploscapter pachys TaxID=2018661 RepID=A0A2A2KMM6_9BILA|nr:hypothetical protein WR25_01621 [Diploscapter pachys]
MRYLLIASSILFWILISSIDGGIYGGYETQNFDTGGGSYRGGNSYGNGYAGYNAPQTYVEDEIYEEYPMSSESSESTGSTESSSSESKEIKCKKCPTVKILELLNNSLPNGFYGFPPAFK